MDLGVRLELPARAMRQLVHTPDASVVDVQSGGDGPIGDPAVGHDGTDHEFGEVVAEWGERERVEIDGGNPLGCEDEVADVGVLVQGGGPPGDIHRYLSEHLLPGPDEVGDHDVSGPVRPVEPRGVEVSPVCGRVEPAEGVGNLGKVLWARMGALEVLEGKRVRGCLSEPGQADARVEAAEPGEVAACRGAAPGVVVVLQEDTVVHDLVPAM
jgi:hypothetical protein